MADRTRSSKKSPTKFSSRFRYDEQLVMRDSPLPTTAHASEMASTIPVEDQTKNQLHMRLSEEAEARKRFLRKQEKRKFEKEIEKVSFTDAQKYNYDRCPLKPGTSIMKKICPESAEIFQQSSQQTGKPIKSQLKMNLPDTFVFGVDENPYWLFTGKNGHVYRVESVRHSTILSVLLDGAEEMDIVAIAKRPGTNPIKTDVTLLYAKQLNSYLQSLMTGLIIIQKFVKFRNKKASVTRFVWSLHRSPVAYVITNRKSYDYVDPEEAENLVPPPPAEDQPGSLGDSHPSSASLTSVLAKSGGSGSQARRKKMLTDHELIVRYCACMESFNSATIFKMNGKEAVQPLASQAQELVTYLENTINPRIRFSELVADFIRDEGGMWWFIQLRAFQWASLKEIQSLRALKRPGTADTPSPDPYDDFEEGSDEEAAKPKLDSSKYKRHHTCRMCCTTFKSSDLGFQLTLKMIYDTEEHLKQRQVRLDWFDRPLYRSLSEQSQWYEPYPVCEPCYQLYKQERKLMDLELRFARAIGVPINHVDSDLIAGNDPSAVGSTGEAKFSRGVSLLPPGCMRRVQGTNALSDDMEKQLMSAEEILRQQNRLSGSRSISTEQRLQMYRFFILIHELRDMPDLRDINHVVLEFEILGNHVRLPLYLDEACRKAPPENRSTKVDVPNAKSDFTYTLPLQRMRVFYFFVANIEHFEQYINEQQKIEFYLSVLGPQKSEFLGSTSLPLKQFGSGLVRKGDFLQLFSSRSLGMASLKISVGFCAGEDFSVSGLGLTLHRSVFVPSSGFFTADPLPDEWMKMIPRGGWKGGSNVDAEMAERRLAAMTANPEYSYIIENGIKDSPGNGKMKGSTKALNLYDDDEDDAESALEAPKMMLPRMDSFNLSQRQVKLRTQYSKMLKRQFSGTSGSGTPKPRTPKTSPLSGGISPFSSPNTSGRKLETSVRSDKGTFFITEIDDTVETGTPGGEIRRSRVSPVEPLSKRLSGNAAPNSVLNASTKKRNSAGLSNSLEIGRSQSPSVSLSPGGTGGTNPKRKSMTLSGFPTRGTLAASAASLTPHAQVPSWSISIFVNALHNVIGEGQPTWTADLTFMEIDFRSPETVQYDSNAPVPFETENTIYLRATPMMLEMFLQRHKMFKVMLYPNTAESIVGSATVIVSNLLQKPDIESFFEVTGLESFRNAMGTSIVRPLKPLLSVSVHLRKIEPSKVADLPINVNFIEKTIQGVEIYGTN